MALGVFVKIDTVPVPEGSTESKRGSGVGQNKKNDCIELIRFIAAFSVIFVHIPGVGYGNWGVDIFFVVSGLVMMLSTERGGEYFFLKRLIRIVPTYYLFTAGVFAIALFKPSLLNGTSANFWHLAKSLAFIPFDKNGAGHFPILFLGWTLNFEMAFYLLFALAMKMSFKYRGLLASLFVLSLYFASNYAHDYPFVVYSNSVILEFLLGIALYELLYQKDSVRVLLLLALYLTPCLSGYVSPEGRGYSFGFPSFVFCFLLLVALSRVRIPRFFVFMGGASYALYLTHPYVIQVFDKITHWFAAPGYMAALAMVSPVLLCFAVASLFYVYIEGPLRNRLRAKLLG